MNTTVYLLRGSPRLCTSTNPACYFCTSVRTSTRTSTSMNTTVYLFDSWDFNSRGCRTYTCTPTNPACYWRTSASTSGILVRMPRSVNTTIQFRGCLRCCSRLRSCLRTSASTSGILVRMPRKHVRVCFLGRLKSSRTRSVTCAYKFRYSFSIFFVHIIYVRLSDC